jgi:hypothetical protein
MIGRGVERVELWVVELMELEASFGFSVSSPSSRSSHSSQKKKKGEPSSHIIIYYLVNTI